MSEAALPTPRDRVMAAAAVAIPMVLAALLIWPALGRIPGVNADESWVLERIEELDRGHRPWNGMTFYVAAMHQYVTWPFVHWLGWNPVGIRASGAFFNVLAVGLVAFTMQRRFGARVGLAAGVLLATTPSFATLSRFGIEVPALSPFLAAVAFACFAALRSGRAPRDLALAFVGGAGLGALAYNHVVLLPIPVTVFIVLAIVFRKQFVRQPVSYAGVLGFLAGCSPRLYDLFQPGMWALWMGERGSAWWRDLLPMLGLLIDAWSGRIMYQRLAGGSAVPVLPYPLLAALVVIGVRVWARRRDPAARGFSRAEIFALVGVLLGAGLTTRISPHLSIRYAVILHVSLPVIFALAVAPLLDNPNLRLRRVGLGAVAAVVALNLAYLGVNFYAPFVRGDGGLSIFAIGTRLVETSNHFARTEGLYRRLRAAGIQRVDADIFIARPLLMYDRELRRPDEPRLEWGGIEPALNAPGRASKRSAVIMYNGPQWHSPEPPPSKDDARTLGPVIHRGSVELKLDPRFPPLFRVYVAQGWQD